MGKLLETGQQERNPYVQGDERRAVWFSGHRTEQEARAKALRREGRVARMVDQIEATPGATSSFLPEEIESMAVRLIEAYEGSLTSVADGDDD